MQTNRPLCIAATLTKAAGKLPDDVPLAKFQAEVADVVKALKAQREAKVQERAAFDKAKQKAKK